MAFTIVNLPGVPMITRGRSANLGTLALTNQAVAFSVSQLVANPNGTDALTITTGGNLTATAFVLEGTIDAGASWFLIVPSGSTAGTNNSTAIITPTGAADTNASSANTYNITGLSGLTLFRFGVTGTVTGSGAVWVATP